jgi:trimeric autotransporter adhesin
MKLLLARLGAVLLALSVEPLHAASYCVDSSLDLATALAASAASSEDDVIRIRTGSYSNLGAIDRAVEGALSISGGWSLNCLLRSEIATTTLSGSSSNDFKLTMDNSDFLLQGLTFSGWSQVILSDLPMQFGPPTAEIRVSRSRFTNGLIGLFINAGAHNIVVENSRFDANSNAGLHIYRTAASFGSADVLLQFNTITSPSSANASGLRVSSNSTAPAANISIYNTVMHGNQFDLRISDQPVRVRQSFWNTELFTAPGGLTAGSGNNFSGDPGIDAGFRPIEPTSILINNGVALVGSTPSSDFDGGPRVVGILPDIGAYESSVLGTAVLLVSNSNDSGPGSLRNAITTANAAAGDAVIQFDIPGGCPHTISLSSSLPTIAKSVRIEGYSQPGSVENGDPDYFDGTVCVFLLGNNALVGGLNLITDEAADTVHVSGLGFYGFNSHAILIGGPGKAQVRGSLFSTGALVLNQNFADTVIRVVNAPGTVIGGDTYADRNVIGGGDQVGIRLNGGGPRTVKYNLIGTNRSGNGGIANGVGVRVEGSIGDVIRNNTIAFNTAQGVLLVDGADAPQSTEIFKNRIGASGPDLAVGGNGGNAVRVAGGNNHEISSNRIYNNATDGIAVLANSRGVRIIGNRFVNNLRLPIDLSPDGRNFNDLDVGQTGANDRQNFPSLFNTGGTATEGSTRVQLSSANGTYTAQIYASTRCTGLVPGSGHDDAGVLLASSTPLTLTCATPSLNCTGSVVVPLAANAEVPNLIGQFINAIVWDEENNTSEFSVCFPYEADTNIVFKNSFE